MPDRKSKPVMPERKSRPVMPERKSNSVMPKQKLDLKLAIIKLKSDPKPDSSESDLKPRLEVHLEEESEFVRINSRA